MDGVRQFAERNSESSGKGKTQPEVPNIQNKDICQEGLKCSLPKV